MGARYRYQQPARRHREGLAPWGPRRRGTSDSVALAIVFVLGAGLVAGYEPLARPAFSVIAEIPALPQGQTHFSLCASGRGSNCVIDGDTLRYGGQTIRIADIDTPEVRDHACAEELALGRRATERLRALVNAGPFRVEAYGRDEDLYGRKLRILSREGRSIGKMLVAEGLARDWDGARRGWC